MSFIHARRTAAAAALAAGVLGAGAATTSAATNVGVTSGAVTKAFSYYSSPGSKTAKTLFNIDGFSANARCSSAGSPIVFAFSSGPGGDLLGHVIDGAGRVHVIHNTSFNKKSKGQGIYPSSSDFDASGVVAYEDINSRVVTVTYALDNSTTLNGRKLCTVYGTYTAS